MGPVSTYMTSCDGDCTKFDASDAKWFKVDASGYTNGKWAATQLIDNGFKWTSTIPSGLKAGNYVSLPVDDLRISGTADLHRPVDSQRDVCNKFLN